MPDFVSGILSRQRTNVLVKEVFRKSIHICSAFVPTMLCLAYWDTIALLAVALFIYTLSEILRMNNHPIPFIAKITETAARKRDENKFVLGPVTLVLGILAAAILLPPHAARIGIYALSFGDGLASLCGKTFGHIHIPFTKGKTAAGSIACFAAVFISSFCVCQNAFVALILAFCAMVIEVLPLADFDNLIIPFVIGSISLAL